MKPASFLPFVAVSAVLGAFALWPAPAVSAPKAYKVVEVKDGATIRGFCRLKEEAAPWKVKVFKDNDKGCGDAERDTERMIAGEGRALANCLVYLKAIDSGKDWPEALAKEDRKVLIDQKGCRYVPHLLWARPETQVAVGNGDGAEHNIHGYKDSMAVTQFNFASPPGKVIDDYEGAFLENQGIYIVKCDIHPWMSAYVHVVAHPYHDVTSAVAAGDRKPGEFVLTGVPPGAYTVVAWHEGMEETAVESGGKIAAYNYSPPVTVEIEVTCVAGKTSDPLEFVFEAPKKK